MSAEDIVAKLLEEYDDDEDEDAGPPYRIDITAWNYGDDGYGAWYSYEVYDLTAPMDMFVCDDYTSHFTRQEQALNSALARLPKHYLGGKPPMLDVHYTVELKIEEQDYDPGF